MERRREPGGEEARDRILRQATVLTYGFMALAVLVAVGGAAFLAWLFTAAGLPFLKTWLVLTMFTLGIPLLGQVFMYLRSASRRRRAEENRDDNPTPWSDG